MGLWRGFIELIGLGDGPGTVGQAASRAAVAAAHGDDDDFGARPQAPLTQFNPTTGLAMNEGSLIDVGGNLYGAQLDSGAPDIDWMPIDTGGFDAFDC